MSGIFMIAFLVSFVLFRWSNILVYIPNGKMGILERKWSLSFSKATGIVALGNEPGFLPEVLRGGFHFFVPFQYRVRIQSIPSIPSGQMGYIYARAGNELRPGQVTADDVGVTFEDAREFLQKGGQKGPQRALLREGLHYVNTALFVVLTKQGIYAVQMDDAPELRAMDELIKQREGYDPIVISGDLDDIGIVTVHDGPQIEGDAIIAPAIPDCGLYQNPESFLQAGGRRGRQQTPLLDGTYYINRRFATVDLIPKTVINVGEVGVVISYTGKRGEDLSGDQYRHGELVANGERGVWKDPLMPGKYAFNIYSGKISKVPTTNFILKWESGQAGSQFDENLKDIPMITKDAFEPLLPMSVVVSIDYKEAPLVIQRFGDIQQLVEQTLDPMVSAFFKNVAQTKTLVELLQQRSEIQTLAATEMREMFARYNLKLQEVLIGTPRTGSGDSERILEQLRERQIAREQVATYAEQQKAAEADKNLQEARAIAEQQAPLTRSKIAIDIQRNEGEAEATRAEQEAKKIETLAHANAKSTTLAGEAVATAARSQVEAYGGPQYRLSLEIASKFADAIKEAKLPIVPNIVAGGGSNNGGSSLEGLLSAFMGMSLEAKEVKASVAHVEGGEA